MSRNLIWKIVAVFVVGLFLRGLFNLGFVVDLVDVFTNKTNVLIFSFISSFLVVLLDLFNTNVINLNIFRSAIKCYIENKLNLEEKLMCGGDLDGDVKNRKSNISDEHLFYNHKNSGGKDYSKNVSGYGSRTKRPSAGIRALYGDSIESSSSSRTRSRIYSDDDNRARKNYRNRKVYDVKDRENKLVVGLDTNRFDDRGYSKEVYSKGDNKRRISTDNFEYEVPVGVDLRNVRDFAYISGGDRGNYNRVVDNVHSYYKELDSKSIYEMGEGKKSVESVKELDSTNVYETGRERTLNKRFGGIYTAYRPEVSYNTTEQKYIPYRPEPVELDTNTPRKFNPWSADSYNEPEVYKSSNTGVDRNENTNESFYSDSSYDNYYSHRKGRFSDSTKLGEIYSPNPSEERRYMNEHPRNKVISTNVTQQSKRGKLVDKLVKLVIK